MKAFVKLALHGLACAAFSVFAIGLVVQADDAIDEELAGVIFKTCEQRYNSTGGFYGCKNQGARCAVLKTCDADDTTHKCDCVQTP